MIAMTTQTAMMSSEALCVCAVLVTLVMGWRTVQVRKFSDSELCACISSVQFQCFHSQILMNVFLEPTCVM